MSTLIHRLNQWAKEQPHAPAQLYKDAKTGEQKTLTAQEYLERVFHLALYLESKGMGPKDTVAILAYNRPEWVHFDLAPHLLGTKTVGLYPNSTSEDMKYVIEHSEAKILAVQDRAYFEKLTEKNEAKNLPAGIESIIVFDGDIGISAKAIAYADAIKEGKKLAAGKSIDAYLNRLDENAGLFLIYTSGTTAKPKGALISHDNLTYVSDVAIDHFNIPLNGEMFSFLPLCHIAEKLQNIGVGITGRFAIHFCSKFENLSKELLEVEPTVLLCVPRLWEKMMEGVQAKLAHAPGLKKKMATWAFSAGRNYMDRKLKDQSLGLSDVLQYRLADRLVLKNVRKALGLGRLIKCASGAAALPSHVTKWFRGIGIEILEDFGQTETTGVICMTIEGKDCAGTVGIPVPGIEFRLSPEGEIQTKGRHVFKGYYKNDQASDEAFTPDGWLKTGDLGQFTPEGMVKIVGRCKEIMKSSGGKMVAPSPIEEKIKSSGIISQACMVGDGRKYFTAIVTLSEQVLKRVTSSDKGVDGEVIKDPAILGEVQKHMDDVNAGLPGFEKIKYFVVLSREFSIDQGEMTPTLKMKRHVIENKFKNLIDAMYGA